MDAFWKTDKKIIFCTSVDALRSNPPFKFYECMSEFFPKFKGKNNEEIEKEFRKKKVNFLSFAQLAHYLLIANPLKVKSEEDKKQHMNFLQNSILIIDEVHSIFRPLPNQKKEHDALRKLLLDVDDSRTKGMKLIILTATPGDSPETMVKLLNMIRKPKSNQITVPDINSESELSNFKN